MVTQEGRPLARLRDGRGLVEDVIPELPPTTLGIYAVYPPGRFTQPKVRAFIDFLVERFADKGPDIW